MEQSRVDWPAFITCVVIILVVCIPLALTAETASDLLEELYAHWILGERATAKQPRWSVLRDVLGWVE